MPLPALPILAALWAAKTGGTYFGYKKLKEKNPELVAEWEQKARDLKGQVKDVIWGKEEPLEKSAKAHVPTHEKDEGEPPPSP